MKLIEELAKQEHEQWMQWAKNLIPELQHLTADHLPYGKQIEAGNCGCETCQRIKRWQALFVPYEELTEAQKDQDREWAKKGLALVKKAGYAKLPKLEANKWPSYRYE